MRHLGPVGIRVDAAGHVWVTAHRELLLLGGDVLTPVRAPDGSPIGGAVCDASAGGVWAAAPGALRRVLADGRIAAQIAGGWGRTQACLEDRHGTVWIAAEEALVRVAGGRVLERVPAGPPLHGDLVTALAEDGEGNLWLGLGGKGLLRLGNVEAVVYGAPEGLAGEVASSFAEDADGVLWAASQAGVRRLVGGRFTAEGVPEPLRHLRVGTMLADAGGSLWIGTVVGVAPGGPRLPADILSQLGDADGTLWVGTDVDGLWRLRDGRWFRFGRAQGLAEEAVAGGRRDRHRSGPPAPRPAAAGGQRGLARGRRARPFRRGPALDPGTRRLTFQLGAVAFSGRSRLRFRYRLDGYDADWSEPTELGTATYTNLPPGRYRLRAQAGLAGDAWGPESRSPDVTQRPFLWQTRGFLAACAATLLLGGLGYHRPRLRRLRRRAEELRARVDEALAEVKTLSGLLPVCAWCRKVRDDAGYWQQLERYVAERTGAQFSHGMCPSCYAAHDPEGTPEP